MTRLSDFFSCGKHRWICSAFCTAALFALVFSLPVWDFHVKAEVSEDFSENAVSVVTVTQRRRVKAVEKKLAPPPAPKKDESVPVIPKKSEEVEKKQEEAQTEKIEETEEVAETAESEETAENEVGETSENAETGGEEAGEAQNAAPAALSEDEKKALASYKSYALSRIASKKTYPYSARSKGIEGKVRVRVVIQTDGTVSECEILQPCEHEVLNEACLSAIKKSAPFKKMKQGMEAMTLVFVMDFSLK